MIKQLSKEIMKRSKLPNNFLKNKKKIKLFITGKGIPVYFFRENLTEDTIKT